MPVNMEKQCNPTPSCVTSAMASSCAGPHLADTEKLVEFNSKIHCDLGPETPDTRVGVWTRDLMTKAHPTFHPDDFTIVEDTADGKIVSSLNLISQTWSYGGIPFGVGRPELVGTLPEYRNRGLVRAQFEVIHQWSAERGEKVQAITGIPYYYRIFGYEMGLELHGGRAGFLAHIPRLKEGETEPYHIRPAVESRPGIHRQFVCPGGGALPDVRAARRGPLALRADRRRPAQRQPDGIGSDRNYRLENRWALSATRTSFGVR